ncbi:hypothetical protein DFA_00484 [Cavenderia fasciculata]|uniref:Secreted protein n=1 Tax=Cavenderia fasciculata TaxID=261658 RepID=F4PS25_CACFS|nr:uncharacterized protein DFA_00484 [Cavenderia fasciculata]EGG20623.1 hypothetical protein DFA_00484 [Cavenderia fasciculata]|eukprot:XP_004358473.1 hypothetical protein DFA_00484 [Cavenderia fasciculata]
MFLSLIIIAICKDTVICSNSLIKRSGWYQQQRQRYSKSKTKIYRLNDNPPWMNQFAPRIIDLMIRVLDRHAEKKTTTTRNKTIICLVLFSQWRVIRHL